MYPGHFAAGLALKVIEPKAPTLGLMIGVGLLDLGYAVGVALGVEGGTLRHIICPWSHSLLSATVLSLGYAALFAGRGLRVAAVMAAAVMSHWVLDVLTHNPDMQLYPNSPIELGYGAMFGGQGGWLEAGLTLVALAAYIVWARRPEQGRRRWGVTLAMIGLMYAADIAVVSSL